jgi:dienelactone hydrolase
MRRSLLTAVVLLGLLAGRVAHAETGTVTYQPLGDQSDIPEAYRLGAHQFDFELDPKPGAPSIKGLSTWRLRFPSPFQSPHAENNTVHAEYYRPDGAGPFPGVIVLDITGGDQSLSRTISTIFAQHGVAALFVQMAYYGPRRPPGSDQRFLSPNLARTTQNVRQTVLDLRRATAWLANRPELDPQRLGILGTSLGSFMAALTGEMEPRLGHVAVLLGGAGLIDAYWDHPKALPARRVYEAVGGTKERLKPWLAQVDPITCAANLKQRRLLILAAKRDEIVPPSAAIALWKASGEQKIVWYDTTHYGAILYLVPAMVHIVKHFKG